jgi:signal recognition particle receptor subunit beta
LRSSPQRLAFERGAPGLTKVMVFFNYATMQMAAKVVYYGPGLCGKTTNLHHIYGRTAPGSRGEMVSLETETDRTLFFDLLPLDVGVIGGFKTRVQLYTVPGQVFYNTTRKLVLKGVDGIVFVADSQRAMKDANVESFANLKTNLAEIGVKLDEIPLVLQYNKRDLANILSLEELEDSMNAEKLFESYEACAVLGQGVFETLKAISRLTLRSLKKRMLGEEKAPAAAPAPKTAPVPKPADAPAARPPAAAPKAAAKPARPAAPPPPPPPPAEDIQDALDVDPGTFSDKGAKPLQAYELNQPPSTFDGSDQETVQEFEQALDSLDAPLPEAPAPAASATRPSAAPPPAPQSDTEIADVSFAQAAQPEPEKAIDEEVRHVKVRSNIDILAELERLRKTSTSAASHEPDKARRPATGISVDDLLASSLNHRKEISKVFEVQVPRKQLTQGHQVTVGLRFEDPQGKEIGEGQSFAIELQSRSDIERLLLSLKFHILGK